ncbi:MAG TPA: ABC transporter permease, partial [Methanomicrobia archaeon]|nr:ABC transporter permease [Methanomicrobia archaeon]
MVKDTEFKRRTRRQDIIKQLRKNKTAMIGLVMLLAIFILCIGAPIFAPH